MNNTLDSSAVREPDMAITERGSLRIRMDDLSFMDATHEYLRAALNRAPIVERENEQLKERLRYTNPASFVPEMVAALELKAEKAAHDEAAGAYSNAARLLRKAL